MSEAFRALGAETVYSGRLVQVRIERFRHADGEEVSREVVRHQGAVGVVAYDEREVWLVRQPREAVSELRRRFLWRTGALACPSTAHRDVRSGGQARAPVFHRQKTTSPS